MKLEVNKQYNCGDGVFIIPRSKFKENTIPTFAVIELRNFDGNGHYRTQYTTMSKSELRELFKLAKREKVEII